jgi:hypothetical protein
MDSTTSPRRVATIHETVRAYPLVFQNEDSLRWQLKTNAEFAKACSFRLGKRVLIDLDAFEALLDELGMAR